MNHGLSHESPTPCFDQSWRGKIPFLCVALWLPQPAGGSYRHPSSSSKAALHHAQPCLLTAPGEEGGRPLGFHTPSHISGELVPPPTQQCSGPGPYWGTMLLAQPSSWELSHCRSRSYHRLQVIHTGPKCSQRFLWLDSIFFWSNIHLSPR